jgi:hypothetical protein
MGGLYFKSGKDACISFKLWNIGQWVLQILSEKILTESIKRKANLKWWTLKLLLKNFHFWEFFNLGRPPMRIRPPKKKNLSIFFHHISVSTPEVVHFLSYLLLSSFSSVPSSPRLISIRARLWALILSPFERAFEPSSYLHSRAPSSPRPSKVVHFLSYLLWSASSSPHFPSSFYLLNNTPSSPIISY